MVTREGAFIPALTRYRLGTALVWVGVLAWAPFIILQISGHKPSLLWFLPFHLLGVVGGSRLRASARKELGASPSKKNLLRMAGYSLIFVGVLVWLPYFYLQMVAQKSVDIAAFLPFHLTCVFGGVALLIFNAIINRQEG